MCVFFLQKIGWSCSFCWLRSQTKATLHHAYF